MRLIFVGGAIAYRALFNWTTPSMFIGTLLVGPVFQLLFFAYLGRQLGVANDGFYIVGNAVLAASALCLFGGTMAVSNERRYSTLSNVLLSPRSRTLIFLGRALPYAGNGLLVATFTLVVGKFLLNMSVPGTAWFGLILTLAAASLSAAFFGLVLGSIGLRFRDVWLISNSMVAVMILLSGTTVPRENLPAALRAIGDFLPLTHAAAAARELAGGETLANVLPGLGLEVAIGAGYAIIAAVLLKIFEYESRRTASLDTL
ncbi:ABC transporter permease [Catelliglobosispora koreensis]|uniref:ABC transporter permease n=1 Tax=Catelliglobosispora koreensis TaxID=129052 RepID=UPI00037331E0|nr:ABC transporter permease [Catelliglobosispora koreensis]